MKIIRCAAMGLMILSSLYATANADYKRDIGYTKLAKELGGSIADGSGVVVAQVEAANGDGYWMPDDTNPQFDGKTLIFHTGSFPGEYSNHGTAVGKYFYGNASSMVPGVATIDCYSADYWLDLDFLRTLNTQKPFSSASRVANHSWIGDADVADTNSDVLRRLDWVIETDDFIQAVGLSNGATNRPLLGSALNAIAVGRSDGGHGIGSASVDDTIDDVYLPARTRPLMVAPLGTTSAATPVVASASALLIGVGHNDPDLSTDLDVVSTTNRNGNTIYNAERSEVIKAVLMAGADRDIINWSGSTIMDYRVDPANRTTNGLDNRFGAGQINIYNSYHILIAGEQNSLEDDPSGQGDIGFFGFDYDPSFGGSGSTDAATYFFTADSSALVMTASLAWNLEIDGGSSSFNGAATLHDLDLLLYDITNPGNPLLMASADSKVENTESLWTPLENGHDYEIRIINGSASTFEWDYALAWQITVFQEGDMDVDGTVDGLDLAVFASAYGFSDGDPAYHPDADFDGNNTVDEADLAKFTAGLGQTNYP